MKPKISTTPTKANIKKVLQLLEEMPGHLERLSARLSDAELRKPLDEGERSFTEDLAHLLNSEALTAQMIYMALLVEEPYFDDVHPERHWGKLVRFEQYSFADLVAYYKFRRTVLLNVLRSLTDEQWERVIREEGKQRKESVYWRARALALHEHDHLTDLQGKLAKIK
ncbi:MAG: DinB family protein [Chloroflexi bacterium]|nr:DinB family protein [Chloroflexota bacterium]